MIRIPLGKPKRIRYRRAKAVECKPLGMSRREFRHGRRKYRRWYKKNIKETMRHIAESLSDMGYEKNPRAELMSLPPMHNIADIHNISNLQLTGLVMSGMRLRVPRHD